MRIFVYEFITGGGWFVVDAQSPPSGSLLREGMAMVKAVAEDLAALPDVMVTALWDSRLRVPKRSRVHFSPVDGHSTLRAYFRQAADRADYSLVIAPEFDSHLLFACQDVVRAGGELLGPEIEFVTLAADKHRTVQRLAAAGVSVPYGVALVTDQLMPLDFPYPAVLKPRHGAGSQDLQLVTCSQHAQQLPPTEKLSRLEQFCPGEPASVAALCGAAGKVLLPPMRQILSEHGRFSYLGGDSKLSPAQRNRAHDLANQALAALPATSGYVGMDMILGDDDSGAGDVVVEVNPRLTTSYVGLRAIMRENLAGVMLQLATGGGMPDLTRRECEVEFTADGEVAVRGDEL